MLEVTQAPGARNHPHPRPLRGQSPIPLASPGVPGEGERAVAYHGGRSFDTLTPGGGWL